MQRARLAQPSRRVERCSERHFAPPERPAATAPSLTAQPARMRKFQWAAQTTAAGRSVTPSAAKRRANCRATPSRPARLHAQRAWPAPLPLAARWPPLCAHLATPKAHRRQQPQWQQRDPIVIMKQRCIGIKAGTHKRGCARYEACSACSHPNARAHTDPGLMDLKIS